MSIRDSISNEVEREHWIALVNGNSHTKQCIPVEYYNYHNSGEWEHYTEGNWSIDVNNDNRRVVFTHCDHKTGMVFEWHFDDLHQNVHDYCAMMW